MSWPTENCKECGQADYYLDSRGRCPKCSDEPFYNGHFQDPNDNEDKELDKEISRLAHRAIATGEHRDLRKYLEARRNRL